MESKWKGSVGTLSLTPSTIERHQRNSQYQKQPSLPFHDDYDKMVEEAMDGTMMGDENKAKAQRKGTASGSVREV